MALAQPLVSISEFLALGEEALSGAGRGKKKNGIDRPPIVEETNNQIPHPLIAIIPLIMLIGLLTTILILFGSDALSGGSQIALLIASAICICVSMFFYRTPWKLFEPCCADASSADRF